MDLTKLAYQLTAAHTMLCSLICADLRQPARDKIYWAISLVDGVRELLDDLWEDPDQPSPVFGDAAAEVKQLTQTFIDQLGQTAENSVMSTEK